MNEMTGYFLSANTEIKAEKDKHLERIYELRKACEKEMFTYIEKYILDGRRLDEVFPVAYQSVLDDVNDEGYVYGHYVLEHIIDYTDIFSEKEEIRERYLEITSRGEVNSHKFS